MAADKPTRLRKWLERLPGFAVTVAVLVFAWPMLKGWAYGVFPPEPPSAEEMPAWRTDYESALREAAESGKPVLIDFMASWCPPCRVMEADVWPDPEVRAAVDEHVVPLQIDVDDPANARLSKRYQVRAIPSILLVNAEGEEIERNGYMSSRSMIGFVERHSARRVEQSSR